MNNNLETVVCKNCGNTFQGNYCNICGQKVITSRFTFKIFIIDAIESTFNIERGFFFTVQQLLKNPGKAIKEYLGGRTKDYFNPIKYLVILIGISVLIALLNNAIDESYKYTTDITKKYVENAQETDELAQKIIPFIKRYFNVFMILMVPFYSLGFKIFFSRSKLYYTEHLIINCYAYGTGTLLSFIVSLLFMFLTVPLTIQSLIGSLLLLLIYIYFYHRITEKNLISSILLSVSAMIVGLIFIIIVFLGAFLSK